MECLVFNTQWTVGRLRLTEAEYQLSRNGVVSEGWDAEVDRTSAMVFFEWILKVTCLESQQVAAS